MPKMDWDIDNEEEKTVYIPPKAVSVPVQQKNDVQNTPEKPSSSVETSKDTPLPKETILKPISEEKPLEKPSVAVRRGSFLEFLVTAGF